jgi:hypothetical protein
MVNGNDILEFKQNNYQRLWESFVEKYLNGKDPITPMMDEEELFKQFPKLEIAFDNYVCEQFSQRGSD